jgi:HK97 family phage major capsid protein
MKRYIPLVAFAAVVAIACVAVLGLDLTYAAAHASDGFSLLTLADAGMAAALDDVKKLSVELKNAADEVKKSAETTATEIKNLGTVTEATKKTADEALIKHNEISARMTEIEQKLVRRGEGPQREKSLGQTVTDDDKVKDWIKSGGKGRVSMKVKAIISSLTTDADGSAGDLIVPMRLPGIITPALRRMTIRDLITPGRTDKNAIQYIKETGFTNNAATVTETAGTAKAQSDIKFDIVTTAVTTIAHWVLATKQILDDVPQLMSYIDGRLKYGLQYVEEGQLLNGPGGGTDLNGIYTQATAYSAPITPSMAGNLTKIDVIRLAILQAFLAEYPANGIVLHPSDWADIELTKTDEGAYLFANPQNGTDPRLWRLPVVETQAMTVDKFLTGAFQLGAQLFDREDANVEISTEDSDNFRKNLVTIRGEERLALAVYRPESFIKGGFTAALAA